MDHWTGWQRAVCIACVSLFGMAANAFSERKVSNPRGILMGTPRFINYVNCIMVPAWILPTAILGATALAAKPRWYRELFFCSMIGYVNKDIPWYLSSRMRKDGHTGLIILHHVGVALGIVLFFVDPPPRHQALLTAVCGFLESGSLVSNLVGFSPGSRLMQRVFYIVMTASNCFGLISGYWFARDNPISVTTVYIMVSGYIMCLLRQRESMALYRKNASPHAKSS